MQDVVTLIANISAVLFIGLLVLLPILLPILVFMEIYLCKRLDPILLRKPWFKRPESITYHTFPLMYAKVSQYIYLMAYPEYRKRKRFIGLDQELEVANKRWVRVVCKVYVITIFLGMFFLGSFFLLGGLLFILAPE